MSVCQETFLRVEAVVELNVDCPLLSSASSFFSLSFLLHTQPSLSLSLFSPLLSFSPFSLPPPPLPFASNGLNRLASCQSRGLLWLCHKSARKNRNHLFWPGPERGCECKYMSLAFAFSPARAHRTTEHSTGSHSPTRYYTAGRWSVICF